MSVSNTMNMNARSSRSYIRLLAWLIALLLVGFGSVQAGDMMRPDPGTTGAIDTAGALDGQSFVGEFGIVGKPARGTDTWIFRNGSFVSKSCEECGFPQSVYLAHADTDGTAFKAKTSCPVSDAEIVWEGTVKDGKIEGVFTWTKKRWYRTIQKQFWFSGSLEESVSSKSDEHENDEQS